MCFGVSFAMMILKQFCIKLRALSPPPKVYKSPEANQGLYSTWMKVVGHHWWPIGLGPSESVIPIVNFNCKSAHEGVELAR